MGAAWNAQSPLPSEACAESVQEVVDRIESALFDLAAAYPGKKVAVVMHGEATRCLLKRVVAVDLTPGRVNLTTLSVGPGRTWHLVQAAGDISWIPPDGVQAKL